MWQPYRLPRGKATLACQITAGTGPGLLFLCGLRSNMEGTKATALAAMAVKTGRSMVRFDYQGHGDSSGRFEDMMIGTWFGDALHVLDQLTTGPQVIVGSSMGGWIALLLAEARPERVAGLVLLAPAPDFTEDLLMARLDGPARQALFAQGRVTVPSPWLPEPLVFTSRLIEEATTHLIFRRPWRGGRIPTRILHGTRDAEVPVSTSLRLVEHLYPNDVCLTLIGGGDHRLADPPCLARLCRTVAEVVLMINDGVAAGPETELPVQASPARLPPALPADLGSTDPTG